MYLSKLRNWNSCVLCGVGHSTGGTDASPASSPASSNRNIRFPQLDFFKNKNYISPRSCLRYFPISYRAVNGCCTGGGLLEIHLWIFGKYLRSSYYSVPERNLRYFFWVAENYVFERWQNLCDKVILLGHLLLRFLSWRKFFSSDTFSFLLSPPTTFYLHISDEFVKEQHWDSKLN